jgi:hypothetical protein
MCEDNIKFSFKISNYRWSDVVNDHANNEIMIFGFNCHPYRTLKCCHDMHEYYWLALKC